MKEFDLSQFKEMRRINSTPEEFLKFFWRKEPDFLFEVALPHLLKFLSDSDMNIQDQALSLLGQIEQRIESVVEPLLQLLQNSNFESMSLNGVVFRHQIIDVLAQNGIKTAKLIDAVIDSLEYDDGTLTTQEDAEELIESIIEIGACEKSNNNVLFQKEEALKIIRKLQIFEGIPTLIKYIEKMHRHCEFLKQLSLSDLIENSIIELAFLTFGEIAKDEQKVLLPSFVEKDKLMITAYEAGLELKKLTKATTHTEIISNLINFLKSENDILRKEALKKIREFEVYDEAIIPALIETLKDPIEEIRTRTLEVFPHPSDIPFYKRNKISQTKKMEILKEIRIPSEVIEPFLKDKDSYNLNKTTTLFVESLKNFLEDENLNEIDEKGILLFMEICQREIPELRMPRRKEKFQKFFKSVKMTEEQKAFYEFFEKGAKESLIKYVELLLALAKKTCLKKYSKEIVFLLIPDLENGDKNLYELISQLFIELGLETTLARHCKRVDQ